MKAIRISTHFYRSEINFNDAVEATGILKMKRQDLRSPTSRLNDQLENI